MATTSEPKAEAKHEPKEAEENSEPPLKYKTWVLKVSIHCQGCKKKVTKDLKNIDGVYKIEVDMKMQKVTVTGNVEAATLIKKLTKTGKHAELWPDQKANNNSKDKNKSKGKNKEKQQTNCEVSEEHSHGGGGRGDDEKETVNVGVVQGQASANKNKNEGGGSSASNKKVDGVNMVKPSEGGSAPVKAGGGGGSAPPKTGGGSAPPKAGGGSAPPKAGGGSAPPKAGGDVGQVKETKPEVVRQVVNLPNQPPVAEKSGGGGSDWVGEHGGGGGGAGGSGGKNKKNKGPKGNANNDEDEDEQCDDGPASNGSPNANVAHGLNGPPGPRGPRGFLPQGFQAPQGLQGQHGIQAPQGLQVPYGGVHGGPYGPYGPNPVQVQANHNLPNQQHVYESQYPRQYYRPPQQTAAHYNAAPPPYSHSFTYVPASVDPEPELPPYHMNSYSPQQYYSSSQPYYNASQPSDSFELFSDENPNGCHIM